jgi:hypothetical protein
MTIRRSTLRLMVMHPHTKYHWPISKNKNVMTQTRKYYLIKFFWPWDQRSRSHEGHYGMRNNRLMVKVSLHGQDKFYFTCNKWPLVFRVPLHGQDKFYYVSPSNEGRHCFSLIFFFCFFSAKLVPLNTGKIKLFLTMQWNLEHKWPLNTGNIKLVLTM